MGTPVVCLRQTASKLATKFGVRRAALAERARARRSEISWEA